MKLTSGINIMSLIKEINENADKGFVIYFDASGAGRGPEPVAGPFATEKEAEDYADEMEYDLTGDFFIEKDLGIEPR